MTQEKDRFSGIEIDGQRTKSRQAGCNEIDAGLNNGQDNQLARVPYDICYCIFAEKPKKTNYGYDEASRKTLVMTN